MTLICAFARSCILAYCEAKPDETRDVVRALDGLDQGTSITFDIPGIEAFLVTFGRHGAIAPDGTTKPHLEARTTLPGIVVEEGRITLSKGIMPETTWLEITGIAAGGGSVSRIVDLGPAHDHVIHHHEITLVDPPALSVRFSRDTMPWDAFRDELLARHAS